MQYSHAPTYGPISDFVEEDEALELLRRLPRSCSTILPPDRPKSSDLDVTLP